MHQIVDNLLSNAFRFAPISSSININLSSDKGMVYLEIIDEGKGIECEDPNALFEIYQRQNDKPNEATKEGLGLAIVKKYVTAMKGKVWCENAENKGAKFTVELPKMISNLD
jgi:K+-sensing histidine kinase KdpD